MLLAPSEAREATERERIISREANLGLGQLA
jgi:hypothetical protein